VKIFAIEKDLRSFPAGKSADLFKEKARVVWRLIQKSHIRIPKKRLGYAQYDPSALTMVSG
jgi:hypothetical protein